ncbi:multiple_epidermal growth factor-like domains protein [Hexamita inflata]|uniref:Multiple epidermal growth factor-like domains protein n=1 Tax=Hexamita inflata TaxID=28002 RepID=A0AA86R6I7_9EUKA|nr:multiple epidermal growth factor-like domains protein [Hexamita inflata]
MLSFVISISELISPANWLTDVRIWSNQSLYPFTAKYDYMQASPQSTIVTITSLRQFSSFKGNCSFSALDGFKTSSLKNAVYILNVDLALPPNCANVEIAFMNSVQGELDNITVTGWVNVSGNSIVEFRGSQFVGHIYDGAVIGGYYSNLSFLLNNGNLDNSSSVFIHPSNFDGIDIGTVIGMNNAAVIGTQIATCTGSNVFYSQTAENDHQNLIREWYPARLELFEWKMMRSKYYFMDFDVNGDMTTDFTLSVQRAYYYPGTTNIAVFLQDGSQVECSQFYDPISKSCKAACDSGSKIYEQFCQSACPTNYFTASDSEYCYVQCPAKLGYYIDGSVCKKCLTAKVVNLAVDDQDCIASCPTSSPVVVGSGCFAKAQTVQTFVPGICSLVCAPGQLMDTSCVQTCGEGNVSKSSLRICEPCKTSYDGGIYWKRTGAECASSCEYLNNTYCEDLGSEFCEYYYVSGSQKICVHSCPSTYQYLQPEEKRCYNICPIEYIIDHPNSKCVTNCTSQYYYYVSSTRYCLATCGPANYTAIEPDKHATNLRCESACSLFDSKPYSNTHTCVPNCYSTVNKFIDLNGLDCVSSCSYYHYKPLTGFFNCVPDCNSGFFGMDLALDSTYNRCESQCSLFSVHFYTISEIQKCVEACPTDYSFIDGEFCKVVCPDERRYFDDVKNCSASCLSAIPYAEPDNHCVSLCASMNYSVRDDIQPKICVGVCPVYFMVNVSNSNSKQCVSECISQVTHKFIEPVTSECVAVCPAPFYNRDSSTQFLTCLPDCNTNQHGLDVTYDPAMERCEVKCSMFSTLKYNIQEEYKCVDDCPNNLYWQDLTLEKFCLISCGSGNYSANDGLSATRCEPTCLNFEVLKIRYQDTCISKCNYFLKEDECIHSCTLPQLYEVNLCVDSCTEGFKQYGNICSDCVLDQDGLCVEDVKADIIKSVKSGMNIGTWVAVAVLVLAIVAVCVYLLKYLQKVKQYQIAVNQVDQTNGFDSLFDQTLNRTTDQVNDNCDDCEDVFTKHRRERVVVKI